MHRHALLLFALAVPALAQEAVPVPREASRYDQMMDQSPFALATVAAAPKAPEISFAENWNLTGLAKLPDSNGVLRDYVTIRSRDQRLSFSLWGQDESEEPEAAGVRLSSVEWNLQEPRRSVVTLKKGTEFAKVEFGEETTPMSNPGAAPGAPGMPGAAASGRPPGANRPEINFGPRSRLPNSGLSLGPPAFGMPSASPQRTNQRPAIPPPGASALPGAMAVPPGPPPPMPSPANGGSTGGKRVRYINTKP